MGVPRTEFGSSIGTTGDLTMAISTKPHSTPHIFMMTLASLGKQELNEALELAHSCKLREGWGNHGLRSLVLGQFCLVSSGRDALTLIRWTVYIWNNHSDFDRHDLDSDNYLFNWINTDSLLPQTTDSINQTHCQTSTPLGVCADTDQVAISPEIATEVNSPLLRQVFDCSQITQITSIADRSQCLWNTIWLWLQGMASI